MRDRIEEVAVAAGKEYGRYIERQRDEAT